MRAHILELLVKKVRVERSRQHKAVMYTAAAETGVGLGSAGPGGCAGDSPSAAKYPLPEQWHRASSQTASTQLDAGSTAPSARAAACSGKDRIARPIPWKKHTKNSFRLRVGSGGHFFLDGQEAPLDAEIRGTLAGAERPQAETRAGRTLGGHCRGENTPSQ